MHCSVALERRLFGKAIAINAAQRKITSGFSTGVRLVMAYGLGTCARDWYQDVTAPPGNPLGGSISSRPSCSFLTHSFFCPDLDLFRRLLFGSSADNMSALLLS